MAFQERPRGGNDSLRNLEAREGLVRLLERYGVTAVLKASDEIKAGFADFPIGPGPTLGLLRLNFIDTPVGVYLVMAMRPFVIAVPLFTDNNGVKMTVLIETHRAGPGRMLTELPAGVQNSPNESIISAAIRETLEETGYVAFEKTAYVVGRRETWQSPAFSTERYSTVEFTVNAIPAPGDYKSDDFNAISRVFTMPLQEAADIYSRGGSPGRGGIDAKTKAEILSAARRHLT